MELWNDFEGKVVDGQFRLGRLVAPKGRSAFFTATGAKNEPVTVRLIESLNDEDEILARWSVVRGLGEEHLVGLLACGRTVLDGTHLVYAVLEATDAELGEVLRERVLTAEETRAMASAVVAGLEALHGAGLVHEHVEAGSVLAQGEVIKLRSDCVREAPAGAEGETLRRRDAHDFAMLVGFALTGRRDAAQAALPRQFEDLVRNGMSGTWGLREMAALLRPAAAPAGAAKPAAAVVATPAAAVGAGVLPAAVNGGVVQGAARGGAAAAGAGPVLVGARGGAAASAARGSAAVVPGAAAVRVGAIAAAAGRGGAAAGRTAAAANYSPEAVASGLAGGLGPAAADGVSVLPTRRAVEDRNERAGDRMGLERRVVPLAVAAVILLLVLLIWHFVRGGGGQAAAPVVTAPVVTAPEAAPAVAAMKPSAAAGAGRGARAAAPAAAGGAWRVVAFTYLRQDQAAAKAAVVNARHAELRAEVWSPTGRSPYLVSVGGWMTAGEAAAMRDRARRDGLPRDTYAQNYRGR